MQSLVSLEGYDPELRSYLLDHRWPGIMEALLTGLSVMLPWDPWEFVQEKLEYLKQEQITDIQWDMFVDPDMRPKLFRKGMLDSLFDESDQLPEEVFEKAFDFRKKRLQKLCFRGWLAFHHLEGEEMELLRMKMARARQHYVTTMRRKIFTRWRNYASRKKARMEAGCAKLVGTANRAMLWRLFQAWLEDYREVWRAKHWFELQGEGEEGDAEGEWCWPEGKDPVSTLPRETAIMILSAVGIRGLCRCACVCRSWKDITEETQLWNRVDLHPIGPFVTDAAALRLFHKYRPLLGHLNLRRCSILTADSLKMIGQCQNLQDLNLSECDGLTDVAMESIARGCSGLLYLNLSYCCVNDSIIKKLTKYCVSLNYLSLAYCTQFTTKGLHSIVGGKGCRRLVYLDLSGCTQLTEEGMRYIGRGCPILNTLLLNDLPEITDTMLLKLVENCRTLRHVSLLGSSSLSDRCFKCLAQDNRKLRSIKIENDSMLTDNALRSLGRACRDLQHVYVAGCSRVSDQGVKALSHLKKLQVLNIADCNKVSDAGVRHIIESTAGSHLRELNLTNCVKISDVTLLRMSQSCKALTYLSFCYCDHISDAGMDLLGYIPTLTSLNLSGCNITDQGIASLHRNPQFRVLILAELLDITDDGLQKMCSTLVKLETLDLSDCESITDSGTQSIAFNCHLLRTLSTANCEQITDEGARYLSQGCTYLTQLDMSGCSLTYARDKALKHLKKGCTNLKRLDILCCINVTREAVQRFRKRGVEVNYNTDRPKYVQQLTSLSVENLLERF